MDMLALLRGIHPFSPPFKFALNTLPKHRSSQPLKSSKSRGEKKNQFQRRCQPHSPLCFPTIVQTDDELQFAACFVVREDPAVALSRRRGAPPAKVSKLTREIVVASTGSPARERERSIYVTLGSGTYVVMCATFLAGMEGSFKVHSNALLWQRV